MTYKKVLILSVLAFVASVSQSGAQVVQYNDTFDTILPAWTQDRYEPFGFVSDSFDGGTSALLTISDVDSQTNRPVAFSSAFYNTQGMTRPAQSTGSSWTVSMDLYVDTTMISGSNLRRIGMWVFTGNDYPIWDIIRNNAADPFNPNAVLASRWRVYDPEVGTPDGWVELAESINGGWNNLEITGDSTGFTYFLNDSLVYTDTTATNPGQINLGGSVIVNAYNFNTAGTTTYHVDNVNAPVPISSVPEPSPAFLFGIAGLVLALRRRRF